VPDRVSRQATFRDRTEQGLDQIVLQHDVDNPAHQRRDRQTARASDGHQLVGRRDHHMDLAEPRLPQRDAERGGDFGPGRAVLRHLAHGVDLLRGETVARSARPRDRNRALGGGRGGS
jgi:hypothetical protein